MAKIGVFIGDEIWSFLPHLLAGISCGFLFSFSHPPLCDLGNRLRYNIIIFISITVKIYTFRANESLKTPKLVTSFNIGCFYRVLLCFIPSTTYFLSHIKIVHLNYRSVKNYIIVIYGTSCFTFTCILWIPFASEYVLYLGYFVLGCLPGV